MLEPWGGAHAADGSRLGFPPLSAVDGTDGAAAERLLMALWLSRSNRFQPGSVLAEPGSGEPVVWFVKSGWACTFRTAPPNRRQIVHLLLPGDHCGMGWGGSPPGAGLSAVTACEIAVIPQAEVKEALGERAPLANAIRRGTDRQASVLEERVVSLGRRTAPERLAHLFCELQARLKHGQVPGRHALQFDLPLLQTDLADIVGLSAVHVNRTLQALRAQKLIDWRRGWLKILDLDGLRRLAGFTPDYLLLETEGAPWPSPAAPRPAGGGGGRPGG